MLSRTHQRKKHPINSRRKVEVKKKEKQEQEQVLKEGRKKFVKD